MTKHIIDRRETLEQNSSSKMESLRNQMRTKENKADIGGTKDQKISIQKTPSFKEKKKGQSWWFQKQFSGKTTHFYDSGEPERAAAVAAAAFAINLQEASEQKRDTPEASLTKTRRKLDSGKSLLASASKRLSGSFRNKDEQGEKVPVFSFIEKKKPEKAIIPTPSMTKTSTFTDKKPETPTPKIPPPPPPPPPIRQTSIKPVPLRQTPTGPNVGEAKADEWEKTELDKIRQRNEKMKEVIGSWETKRKVNAKSKLIKQESELERRRLKALESFQNKMEHINQIADGARAKADENRKNEELKTREKANRIRTTGKLPQTCFCF